MMWLYAVTFRHRRKADSDLNKESIVLYVVARNGKQAQKYARSYIKWPRHWSCSNVAQHSEV